MTAARFRKIALGMQDAVEGAHMGHPDFRAAGRIFATLHADGRNGMVKLTPDQQSVFVRDYPDAFSPESGAWGRQGCTRVRLAGATEEVLGEAMTLAWRSAAARAGEAGKAGRAGRAAARKSSVGTAHVALLRAVNLGGHNAVSMARLCDALAAIGLADPRSLLQSGNLLFRSGAASTRSLEQLLEKEIDARLGLRTDFFVRTRREWAAIIDANPFEAEAARDPAHLVLVTAKDAVNPADVQALQAAIPGRERVAAGERHAYAVYPDGMGRSRLTTALIEKKLGTRVTARNWNTVLKLAAALG